MEVEVLPLSVDGDQGPFPLRSVVRGNEGLTGLVSGEASDDITRRTRRTGDTRDDEDARQADFLHQGRSLPAPVTFDLDERHHATAEIQTRVGGPSRDAEVDGGTRDAKD